MSGAAVSQQSTALWLRRIADIDYVAIEESLGSEILTINDGPHEGFGLRDHLLAAQLQGNALVQLVLFNLPGRNCPAPPFHTEAPASELPASPLGMRVYRVHYIDRLVKVLEEFPQIPIAAFVEPHSLPYLATHAGHAPCAPLDNRQSHGYVNGVRYAVNRLSQLDNVHIYLDGGSSDRLGWDEDLALASLFMHGVIAGFEGLDRTATQLLALQEADTAQLADIFVEPPADPDGESHPPGYQLIDGFITNVAGYVPLHEPYLGDPRAPDGGAPLASAAFYDGNPRFDEWTYTADWLDALRGYGADIDHLGMVIDTSRNGWGQADRSHPPAPTQNPALVDDLRLDRRLHRGNWCNQPAGLGPRPQAQPDGKAWIDAYAWIHPPGHSDGPSEAFFDGNEPGYESNPWCVPGNVIARESVQTGASISAETGALPGAPFTSRWHTEGFINLIENAWPRLCEGKNDACE